MNRLPIRKFDLRRGRSAKKSGFQIRSSSGSDDRQKENNLLLDLSYQGKWNAGAESKYERISNIYRMTFDPGSGEPSVSASLFTQEYATGGDLLVSYAWGPNICSAEERKQFRTALIVRASEFIAPPGRLFTFRMRWRWPNLFPPRSAFGTICIPSMKSNSIPGLGSSSGFRRRFESGPRLPGLSRTHLHDLFWRMTASPWESEPDPGRAWFL